MLEAIRSRARGCLLGQLAGDSLGSLVEFMDKEQIRNKYPNGVRLLADGGPFHLKAGQPTDDSEMALALARSIIERKGFSVQHVTKAYKQWLDSEPFDCGVTIANALKGRYSSTSESNGSMMRISPLAIWGTGRSLFEVLHWSARDANITHRNNVAVQATGLYAELLAYAIRHGGKPEELYAHLLDWIQIVKGFEPSVIRCVKLAREAKPLDYQTKMGWVLIAFQNALWQMLHAPNFEEGVVDTVMEGGDTDTNAAIAGALLGAIYGQDAVPAQWYETVLNCRTSRPRKYWPIDAIKIADDLINLANM